MCYHEWETTQVEDRGSNGVSLPLTYQYMNIYKERNAEDFQIKIMAC